MMMGPHTYANDVYNDVSDINFKSEYITSLVDESRRRNLTIEVRSEEEGVCFSELIYIHNGIIRVNTDRPIVGLYVEDIKEAGGYDAYIKECGERLEELHNHLGITEEDYNALIKNNEDFRIFGSYYGEDPIIDKTKLFTKKAYVIKKEGDL